MARPCFVANWKMNKTVKETLAYLTLLQKRFTHLSRPEVEIILAPPYTALFAARHWIKESGLPIKLAAQNFFYEAEGPYTGEVSSRMLCEAGCQYVIIGHSERRNSFGESDVTVSAKVQSAMSAGLIPILCVGESAQERDKGKTREVVKRQVREGFSLNVETTIPVCAAQCIVAYEPIWAIGTGQTPTPSEVEQVHQEIAETLREIGRGIVEKLPRILYGGSVNEENVAALMKEPHVNGMLIGGASLSAETFFNIVQLGI